MTPNEKWLEESLELSTVLTVDASSQLRWLVSCGTAKKGSTAGNLCKEGYVRVCICGKRFMGHRLVFRLLTGSWPDEELDHKNGVRNDNRLGNLREVTSAEQNQNTKVYASNKSGHSNVFWDPRGKKWIVCVQAGNSGQRKRFRNFEEACVFADQLKAAMHPCSPIGRDRLTEYSIHSVKTLVSERVSSYGSNSSLQECFV